MLRRMLFAAVLVGALLSGCLDDDGSDDSPVPDSELALGQPGYLYDGPGTLFAGAPLYEDPQNTPHPAYNWPTVTAPAVGPGVPDLWKPNQGTDLPMDVTALEFVAQTPGISSGAGIAIFGSLAVVPSYSTTVNSSLVDISDPSDPKVIGSFLTQLDSHRGATIIAYPTGRMVTVISTGAGLDVWDITDPTDPQPLAPIDDVPSHKVGLVPGTPIIYNARSDGGNGGLVPGPGNVDPSQAIGIIDMYDFSDPENVERLPDFANGYGCHHIYFWNNLEEQKFRGLCAGIEYTQIFDTADPKNPEIIVSVPYGHGVNGLPSGSASIAAFSHYAGLSRDGTILLVGDENGGGIGPIGCVARADTPAGSVSVPIGAVWFYDVSDEENPRYLNHVSASQFDRTFTDPTGIDPTSSCTAHHGRLIPVADGDVLAMSFYGAGVLVVDFSNIRDGVGLPTVVAQYVGSGANVWETWYYNGHLYTGDMGRGMDIIDVE
jgi:hypothetical protein